MQLYIYVYLYICTAVQLHITNPNLMYVPIAIVKLIIPVSSHQNERIPLSLRKKRKQQRDKWNKAEFFGDWKTEPMSRYIYWHLLTGILRDWDIVHILMLLTHSSDLWMSGSSRHTVRNSWAGVNTEQRCEFIRPIIHPESVYKESFTFTIGSMDFWQMFNWVN